MKTITFEGKQYEVEDWVKFVAKDQDGQTVKYKNKPIKNLQGGLWLPCESHSLDDREYRTLKHDNWQESLTEV